MRPSSYRCPAVSQQPAAVTTPPPPCSPGLVHSSQLCLQLRQLPLFLGQRLLEAVHLQLQHLLQTSIAAAGIDRKLQWSGPTIGSRSPPSQHSPAPYSNFHPNSAHPQLACSVLSAFRRRACLLSRCFRLSSTNLQQPGSTCSAVANKAEQLLQFGLGAGRCIWSVCPPVLTWL